MIWAILALLGVPLWLCAAGILMVLLQNRKLRKRHGDVAVRVRQAGKKRWTRGHAIWVFDVFAWRGSPAAWNEELVHVRSLILRAPDGDERRKLHRLGEDAAIATLSVVDGSQVEVAASGEARSALVGPFALAVMDD